MTSNNNLTNDTELLMSATNAYVDQLMEVAQLIWFNIDMPISKDETAGILLKALSKQQDLTKFNSIFNLTINHLKSISEKYIQRYSNAPLTISAIQNFIKSIWYDTIADLKYIKFRSDFGQFIKNFKEQKNYYVDLLLVIKNNIFSTAFNWLNKTNKSVTIENVNNLRQKVYEIYKSGLADETSEANKKMGIDKIIKFLQVIHDIN